MRLWKLYWELEAHDLADWDAGAQPYLEIFLTQRTAFAGALPTDHEPSEQEIQRALTRSGRPTWTEEDFQAFLCHLSSLGYGWLRPEGVRRKLEEVAAAQQGQMKNTSASWWSRFFHIK